MATTKITMTGPLFDGRAPRAAQAYTETLAAEIGAIGQTWIKLDTERMTKSGSNTGAAAEGVMLNGSGMTFTISGGIRKGEFDWPWLEGTSKRNQSTGFRGYKSFRRTRLRMRKAIPPYARQLLGKFIAEMGGGLA